MIKKKVLDPSKFIAMSEQELEKYYVSHYPGGSGPLGMMKIVCELILAVAKLRNIDTSTWKI